MSNFDSSASIEAQLRRNCQNLTCQRSKTQQSDKTNECFKRVTTRKLPIAVRASSKMVVHSCCFLLIVWTSFVLTQAAILARDYLKHYHFLGRMLGKVWLASIEWFCISLHLLSFVIGQTCEEFLKTRFLLFYRLLSLLRLCTRTCQWSYHSPVSFSVNFSANTVQMWTYITWSLLILKCIGMTCRHRQPSLVQSMLSQQQS